VFFSKGKTPNNLKLNFNGKQLEIADEFNYLGVLLTTNGNFNKSKMFAVNKGTKAMYEVLKLGRIYSLSINCQLNLLDKMVKPILLYGCEIWGLGNIEIIERVHIKFCKLLLQLQNSTPTYMIYGELGRYPIVLDVKIRILSFWSKLLFDKESKLSLIIYKLCFEMHTVNDANFPWLKNVHNIINECGLAYISNTQIFINSDWFTSLVKQTLKDQYNQLWHQQTENTAKALTYRLFKDIS
jgi:hypothetical protein